MTRLILQDSIEALEYESLPPAWSSFDLVGFSADKTLWESQQSALKNALKVLWRYYQHNKDFVPNEFAKANSTRKLELMKWYRANGLAEDLHIPLPADHRLNSLLEPYYPIADEKLTYDHLINRACFWMATGSGKSLVLIKLIEILWQLIQRKEIPANDILFLTCRDDLIEQFKRHVDEFNSSHANFRIALRELREYPDVKRESPSLFKGIELTVFYYRSDNLSNEQKEKIVDFRNYDDGGKWYLLLDEAHKGDREDSKRQHICSILSRNGFLFNFSATFTDSRDLVTTAFNFNLSEFVKSGYGKHIAILQQELRAFRDEEDYSGEEKQKIVLKSLMMLAYAQMSASRLAKLESGLYHKPLLLTLVNSVNTKDADLSLFFAELERIGKGSVKPRLWNLAKEELLAELHARPAIMFEDGTRLVVDEDAFRSLSLSDLLELVFNAKTHGEIEVIVRPSNSQELAFKLQTSDRPFALIKIGDIAEWLSEKLDGYEISDGFESEAYFDALNSQDSEINILMGSRSFYEGWDSNRPNVLNFINIGVGMDARKFILQSIGRGVRVEPIRNKRKRLLPLFNSGEIPGDFFKRISNRVDALETLIIFGTDRKTLQAVVEHLKRERPLGEHHKVSLERNPLAASRELLIPTYREVSRFTSGVEGRARFELTSDELKLLTDYAAFINDDRVMMAIHHASPQAVAKLREAVRLPAQYFKNSERSYGDLKLLVDCLLEFFGFAPREFDALHPLAGEINHFENIRVAVADVGELQRKLTGVRRFGEKVSIEDELDRKLDKKEISRAAYKDGIRELAGFVREDEVVYRERKLKIRNVANHYYVPMILSGESERIDYISHIVQEESEIHFLNQMDEYLLKKANKFGQFDWWMFSKLDEHLDRVYIPYYDGAANKIREFIPDFIFWLKKGANYTILFVDPKGTAHSDYQRKIDGFAALFEDAGGAPLRIPHKKESVSIRIFLYTPDTDGLPLKYRRYWFDNFDQVLGAI